MVSLNISLPQLQLFFLVFLRVGAILMSIPIFDSRGIPFFFKIALAFATGIVLFPLLKLDVIPVASDLFTLGISVAGEIFLGLAIGFSVKLIFAGIQLAGQLAGYQMGLAIANVMDPATSEQVPLLAQFNNLIGLLVFLSINAHYSYGAVNQTVREYVRYRGSGGSSGNCGHAAYQRCVWLGCANGSSDECIYCSHAIENRRWTSLYRTRFAVFFSIPQKHIQRSGARCHSDVKGNAIIFERFSNA
jgi:hypothetical protein